MYLILINYSFHNYGISYKLYIFFTEEKATVSHINYKLLFIKILIRPRGKLNNVYCYGHL